MQDENDSLDQEYKIIKGKSSSLGVNNLIIILFAFILLFIIYLIPNPSGLTYQGKMMLGILVVGGILWVTEPIPLAVTGLLIMILQPLLGVLPATEVFSSFGNQAVFFLIGAFIIASAVEKHGLHKRIALKMLKSFETNPKIFTLGIMTSCAFLSFIMPEHGVAALFLPIISSILIAMKIVPKQSNFGKISMLSVAYGCSIGSLGTLVGGARNPLTIGILSDLNPPIIISFFDWMIYSMPIVLISLPIVWIILQFTFPIEIKNITTAKKEINKQVTLSGKMDKHEKTVLAILLLTIVFWIFLSTPKYYGLAVIAIFGSFLLFITGCINWKDVEERVPWGIILLYGGAITLGIGMQTTGAGHWIANLLFNIAGINPLFVILALIILTVLLTNIMSNVGAVAILLPIGLAIATEIPGISPLFASMLIALSGGLAFIFVIGTPANAITYSAGYFSSKDLMRAGVIANIACIVIIFVIATIYWKGILSL